MSSLEAVFRYSYTSNHLVNFNLTKDNANANSYKPLYFVMVSFAPGVKSDNPSNPRTYDVKNSTNFKFSLHEIGALSFALKGHATGGLKTGYVKFSNNANDSKRFMVNSTTIKSKNNNESPGVSMQVAVNRDSPQTIIMTQDHAYSLGMVLEKIFERGLILEMERSVNTTQYDRKGSNNNYSSPNNNIPEPSTSDDSDDDNPFASGFPPF